MMRYPGLVKVLALLTYATIPPPLTKDTDAPVPLNKYEIERGKLELVSGRISGRIVHMATSQLHKQIVYDVIDFLKPRRWIYPAETKKARAKGCKSEKYLLTERGLYYAAKLIPELKDKIRVHLGPRYVELEKEERNQEEKAFDLLVWHFRRILFSGVALPNTYNALIIRTDANSQPIWGWRDRTLTPSKQQGVRYKRLSRDRRRQLARQLWEKDVKLLAEKTHTKPEDWRLEGIAGRTWA